MNQASNQTTQTPQTMPQFYIGEINECLQRSIITIFNNVDHIERGDTGEITEPIINGNRYVTVKILSEFYIENISMYLLNTSILSSLVNVISTSTPLVPSPIVNSLLIIFKYTST